MEWKNTVKVPDTQQAKPIELGSAEVLEGEGDSMTSRFPTCAVGGGVDGKSCRKPSLGEERGS